MSSASLESVTGGASPAPRTRRVVAAALGATVLALSAAGALALVFRGRTSGTELPVLGTLPAFTLRSERGVPFGSADLRGKAWVANFIFTRCPTVCPLLTRKMASLQQRAQELGGALHLASFSVVPQSFTTKVLPA